MIHDLTGLIHTATAMMAVGVGAIIFGRPKRGILHRRLGYLYTVCMVIMLATAFTMYRLTGGFNALHVAALGSCLCVGMGLFYAFRRQPNPGWYFMHYHWMSWSYVGLVAALVAESSTRMILPLLVARYGRTNFAAFWIVVGLATAVVVILGARQIRRHFPSQPPQIPHE